METKIGPIKWWDEEESNFKMGELLLDGYKAIISFPDGSRTEVTISNEIEYFVDVDSKSEYFDVVYVKTKSGRFSHAFMIEDNKQKKRESITNHFEMLNNSLINRQKDLLAKVNEKYHNISKNNEIKNLIYNFVDKTSRFIFLDYINFVCFERYLLFKFGHGKLTLLTNEINENMLTFNSVADDFEENVNIENLSNYYKESFIKIVKLLDRQVNYETSEEATFVTWKLLLNGVIHYYYDLFNKEYGAYFANVGSLTLNECIKTYINIDLIDINSASNASIFTYYLMYLDKFDENHNYLKCNNILVDELLVIIKEKELDDFETSLTETSTTTDYTIGDVDLMNGQEFESFVSHLFRKMGYSTEVTKTSGDQGIDVIVEKNGRKIGVQTKCYSSNVSNKAIQEVVAGLKYYKLSKGIVITNNYFTESAKQLALANDILLWDRTILKEKISEVFR